MSNIGIVVLCISATAATVLGYLMIRAILKMLEKAIGFKDAIIETINDSDPMSWGAGFYSAIIIVKILSTYLSK